MLAELEAQWANLRAGPHILAEREAHGLAKTAFGNWLDAHRDNPSDQYLWHPEPYAQLWTGPSHSDPDGPDEVSIDGIFLRSMRAYCFKQAEIAIEMHGLSPGEPNRFTLAKATAAALQRASLMLAASASEPVDLASRGEILS